MNKKIVLLMVLCPLIVWGQMNPIAFTEYDLDNGLHVILHEDHSTPIVAVSVSYHVGSKNEDPNRTGFAHFFEHLLFEGSENIGRGEYMKMVDSGKIFFSKLQVSWIKYRDLYKRYRECNTKEERRIIKKLILKENLKRLED